MFFVIYQKRGYYNKPNAHSCDTEKEALDYCEVYRKNEFDCFILNLSGIFELRNLTGELILKHQSKLSLADKMEPHLRRTFGVDKDSDQPKAMTAEEDRIMAEGWNKDL